jgi:excisionase family DNA binding protein
MSRPKSEILDPSVNPLVVTVREAVSLSRLGETTLQKLINEGTLKSVRVGKRRLIDYGSLRAFLGLPPVSPPEPRRGRPRKVAPQSGEVSS